MKTSWANPLHKSNRFSVETFLLLMIQVVGLVIFYIYVSFLSILCFLH